MSLLTITLPSVPTPSPSPLHSRLLPFPPPSSRSLLPLLHFCPCAQLAAAFREENESRQQGLNRRYPNLIDEDYFSAMLYEDSTAYDDSIELDEGDEPPGAGARAPRNS